MNVKELSESYEAPVEFKNIADLESFDLTLAIETKEYKNKDEETFKVNEVKIEEVVYRVPNSVLGQIKEILKVKPNTKIVKVSKSGSGLNTVYTTIPMD